MDIRAVLEELNGLLAQGEFERMEARCSELLADGTMPVNYRVLLLDQKAKALTALNRPSDAAEVCREEVPLMAGIFGEEHLHVANCLHNLSMYLGADGRHAEAVPVSERELAMVRRLAPGTSREADALVTLAEHIYEQSRFADADVLLLQAMELYEKNEGRRCLGVSTCLNNLGRSSENQGKCEQGVRYLEEAAGIRDELLGVHPDAAFTFLNYGTGLSALGEYEKGSRALAQCVAIYEALGMEDTEYCKAARKNLHTCLDAMAGQPRSCGTGGCVCR